jgi:hypothetical protein
MVGSGDETAKPPQVLAIGLNLDAAAYVECARRLDKIQGGASRFYSPTSCFARASN